ncbi:MAG: hypothetical protein NT051_04520 [Candidatus Micrarchaeota archaeon]|nr:hypothetical protein [Candidatus Micrarchaeota archaeon]
MAGEMVAKQKLVTAYAGRMAAEKTPVRNDPALAEYLKKVNENGRRLNGGMFALCHTREKLDSYAVAKADGLWLLFEPKIETLKKTRDKPVGKFIAVDIPVGMWSMDSGKVMFGLAPVDSIDLHAHLITHLMYTIIAEKGATRKELAVGTGDDFFFFWQWNDRTRSWSRGI